MANTMSFSLTENDISVSAPWHPSLLLGSHEQPSTLQFQTSSLPLEATKPGKRHWKTEEDTKLLQLVDQNGPRDWAKIASLLETGRTGPSCCARWCRLSGPKPGSTTVTDDPSAPTIGSNQAAFKAVAVRPRGKWSKWTDSEDAELTDLVKKHGARNWQFIASHMSNPARGGDACCGRWMHYLLPHMKGAQLVTTTDGKLIGKSVNNSRWSHAEDIRMITLKLQHPEIGWGFIGDNMVPPRTMGSCRSRWRGVVIKKYPELDDPSQAPVLLQKFKAGEISFQLNDRQSPSKDSSVLESILQSYPEPTLFPELSHIPQLGNQSSLSTEDVFLSTPVQDSVLDPALIDTDSPMDVNIEVAVDKAVMEHLPELPKGTKRSREWIDSEGNHKVKARFITPLEPVGPVVFDQQLGQLTETTQAKISKQWTREEELIVVDLVNRHGRKGWNRIAEQLGTGRSGASISARWQRIQTYGHLDPEEPLIQDQNEEEQGKEGIATSVAESEQPKTVNADAKDGESEPLAPDQPTPTIEEPSQPKARTKQKPKSKKANSSLSLWKSWTPDDDQDLISQVSQFGKNAWALVGANLTKPRSAHAASSRWYDYIVKRDVPNSAASIASKKRWTPEEDAELTALIARHGAGRWNDLGKVMSTGRPGSACRLRYLNYLSKQSRDNSSLEHLLPPLDVNMLIANDIQAALEHQANSDLMPSSHSMSRSNSAHSQSSTPGEISVLDLNIPDLDLHNHSLNHTEDVQVDIDRYGDVHAATIQVVLDQVEGGDLHTFDHWNNS